MKKILFICVVFSIILMLNLVYAGLYLGIEGGDSIPLAYLNKFFSHNWHAGIFFQTDTDLQFLDVRISSQYYSLKAENKNLSFYPLILNLIIKSPWKYSFKPYITGGAGIIWERLKVDEIVLRNYDPVFSGGIGVEYLFRRNNREFGPFLEGTYQFIYQKSMKQATTNGEMILIYAGFKAKLL